MLKKRKLISLIIASYFITITPNLDFNRANANQELTTLTYKNDAVTITIKKPSFLIDFPTSKNFGPGLEQILKFGDKQGLIQVMVIKAEKNLIDYLAMFDNSIQDPLAFIERNSAKDRNNRKWVLFTTSHQSEMGDTVTSQNMITEQDGISYSIAIFYKNIEPNNDFMGSILQSTTISPNKMNRLKKSSYRHKKNLIKLILLRKVEIFLQQFSL